MTRAIAVLVAHARDVPSPSRHELARALDSNLRPGLVLLDTCHRVELFGPLADVEARASATATPGARVLIGDDLARHLVSLAVGRSSAVIGEDQILHQLRLAVQDARRRGPLPAALDHLVDLSLRAGRRARSWLPGRRPSLADVAIETALGVTGRDGPVLVVGAGQIGSLAARAARRHGRPVLVASRSADRAAQTAAGIGGTPVPLDPGPGELDRVAAVVVGLSGPWTIGVATAGALIASGAGVVDLSSPPAVDETLAAELGARFTSVDDLARSAASASPPIAARLDRLIDETLAEYRAWLLRDPERAAARELADRASAARAAELDALWRRIPGLDPAERLEIERMAERLAARLLRDPLERLHGDDDGRNRRAARELFGL